MGLIRKLTYAGTGGLIDIRSDAERVASYSKKLMKERENAPGDDDRRLLRSRR